MNFEEIVDRLKEIAREIIVKDENALDDYNCPDYEYYKYLFADGLFEYKDFGKVVQVHQEGGIGQGDRWNIVKHFVDHNIYISLDGFYSSYEGKDFTGYNLKEVFPQEKTIIVYSEKKQKEFHEKLKSFLEYQLEIRKNKEDKTEVVNLKKEVLNFLEQDLKEALEEEDYLKASETSKKIERL